MARWESGARERLQRAALELYAERGYDGVTVAEIAEAAGLTERTFFRYFADKREVLFVSQDEFEHLFLDGLDDADRHDPMSLVGSALASAAAMFSDDRRGWSRERRQIIAAHPALQERELLKMSALAVALTRALTDRGIDPTTAALAAESGVTVFRTAFAAWLADGEDRPFAQIQDGVLADLRALTGAG